MCEILLVASRSPIALGPILARAQLMERYGIAGFGWGVAWSRGDGQVHGHRDPGRLEDDATARERLAAVEATRVMVHFRRPSFLSTISMADTQPFLTQRGDVAFCHNGEFDDAALHRQRFGDTLAGRADSEVGFRLFEQLLLGGCRPPDALRQTVAQLGGSSNLAYLGADDALLVNAAHAGNPMWQFVVGDARMAATSLHSPDATLFEWIFADATDRLLLDGVAAIEPA